MQCVYSVYLDRQYTPLTNSVLLQEWGKSFVAMAAAAFPVLSGDGRIRTLKPKLPSDASAAARAAEVAADNAAAMATGNPTLWGNRPWRVDMNPEKRLTVGYVSPDFFTHSVSYFVEALLAHHGPTVRVICYVNLGKGDIKTQRFEAIVLGESSASDGEPKCRELDNHSRNWGWKKVNTLESAPFAELILSDEVDILVDLAGHTANNRLDVLALRPAPLQISMLGYPNTTGLPRSAIDYR